jgi:hypothetical protein
MLKVKYSPSSGTQIVKKVNEYFEMTEEYFIKFLLPNKYDYEIVDFSSNADICFVSVQHEDNNLLKSNEINIFMSVENMVPPERTQYKFKNKFGHYDNKRIDTFIHNDVSQNSVITESNVSVIPTVYFRINYFLNNPIELPSIPFSSKHLCLFVSRNRLNENKANLWDYLELEYSKDIHHISQYYSSIESSSCYSSAELLNVFSKYKFIVVMENTHQEGYITEKIFNVFQAGAIPIYDGAPDINNFINPESFLSFDDDDILEKIDYLKDNEKEYNKIINVKKINSSIIDNITKTTQNYLDDLLIKNPPSLSKSAKKRNKRNRRRMRINNDTKILI